MRARTVIGFSLSFLVSLIFLWLAFHRIDWASVRSTFTFQRTLPWTLLGITFYLSGHVIRGLRCRLLVRPEARLRRTTATNIVVVGYAVNNVLPLRLGELARAGMLSRETGLPITQSLTVTFAERLFDGLVLLLMLLGAGLMVPLEGWILPALQVAAAVLGAALAGLLLIIACPQALTHTLARLTGRLGGRAQAFTLRLFTHVLSGVATLRRPAEAAHVLGLSVLVWLFDAALFWALLGAFDLPLHPGWALLAMAVTNIGILVPSAPGHIGPFHYFAMQALVSVGVADSTAAAYALMVHLAIFVPLTLWGAGILWRQGLAVGQTIASVRQAREIKPMLEEAPGTLITPSSYREAPPATTPFLRSLTEAVVPAEDDTGDFRYREQALDRASDFLTGQIRELPPQLRGAFRVGLWAFRVVVALRHGRSFQALSLDRRRQLFEAWAYGRLGVTRQLFRPVRSIVLLAWFEPVRRPAGTVRQGAR